jgi:hypothetical protein
MNQLIQASYDTIGPDKPDKLVACERCGVVYSYAVMEKRDPNSSHEGKRTFIGCVCPVCLSASAFLLIER